MSDLPFTLIEEELIIASIRYAEHKTSGELRVHVEQNCPNDAYKRAVEVFELLNMHETQARNGVLLYLAYGDRKFAIVGDSGIHEKLGDQYWNKIKQTMQESFSHGNITAGIVKAVMDVGHQLSVFFPTLEDDTNELSNDISFA